MRSRRVVIAAVLALLLAGFASDASAADSTADRILLKAARGVDSTLLGLVGEWPKAIYFESRDHGVPYGMTVGLAKGFWLGVARTGVGVYELVTFPIPVPAHYAPILSPPFALEPQETRLAR